MNPHYTYLVVDSGCLLLPLLCSFYSRFSFYREWKHFLLPCLFTASFFLLWDALYTYLGVWGFDKRYVLGFFFLGMPLEEFLFFICIPFACIFSYHAFSVLFSFGKGGRNTRRLCFILAMLLLTGGLMNTDRLYTCVTFLLLSAFLFFCLRKKVSFLPAFFSSFLFVLIPFLLSNGVLTGSFLERVVVWYNDKENLGVRLLTIPVEDIFYAMLLLLMNVYGFEQSKSKVRLKAGGNPYRPG
ncbi:lycopene cyclase domain-containing protein [Chitinophagaceae bacterium MMS25-I14]